MEQGHTQQISGVFSTLHVVYTMIEISIHTKIKAMIALASQVLAKYKTKIYAGFQASLLGFCLFCKTVNGVTFFNNTVDGKM